MGIRRHAHSGTLSPTSHPTLPGGEQRFGSPARPRTPGARPDRPPIPPRQPPLPSLAPDGPATTLARRSPPALYSGSPQRPLHLHPRAIALALSSSLPRRPLFSLPPPRGPAAPRRLVAARPRRPSPTTPSLEAPHALPALPTTCPRCTPAPSPMRAPPSHRWPLPRRRAPSARARAAAASHHLRRRDRSRVFHPSADLPTTFQPTHVTPTSLPPFRAVASLRLRGLEPDIKQVPGQRSPASAAADPREPKPSPVLPSETRFAPHHGRQTFHTRRVCRLVPQGAAPSPPSSFRLFSVPCAALFTHRCRAPASAPRRLDLRRSTSCRRLPSSNALRTAHVRAQLSLAGARCAACSLRRAERLGSSLSRACQSLPRRWPPPAASAASLLETLLRNRVLG